MTTGELLNSESTVSNVAAIIHLQNLAGTGGGQDYYFPYTDLSVNIVEPTLSVNFTDSNVLAEFEDSKVVAAISEDVLAVTFEEDKLDISVICE